MENLFTECGYAPLLLVNVICSHTHKEQGEKEYTSGCIGCGSTVNGKKPIICVPREGPLSGDSFHNGRGF